MPPEASWIFAITPEYVAPRPDLRVILNWYDLHKPFTEITTEAELTRIEDGLKTVPTANFWGIVGVINEEHYKGIIAFQDDLETTWFGETLLGYPLYLNLNPTATEDEWKDEMYLRMVRGFYNYFHNKGINVGTTLGYATPMVNRVQEFYGWPAFNFLLNNSDFVVVYAYTTNLTHFNSATKPYLPRIDELFPTTPPKKFWIITQTWPSEPPWEREAIALEMKNCLDRDWTVVTYTEVNPNYQQTWNDLFTCIDLYNQGKPYYETYVYGKNLLTEKVDNTYGWVEMGEEYKKGPNLLANPSFEDGQTGWKKYEAEYPWTLEFRDGYVGKSAVLIGGQAGYAGGLLQSFPSLSPGDMFYFKARVKTVDVADLEAAILYVSMYDAAENWIGGGEIKRVHGTTEWTLYESTFETPENIDHMNVYPALLYNQGEIWIDEVSLNKLIPITPKPPIIPILAPFIFGGVLTWLGRG